MGFVDDLGVVLHTYVAGSYFGVKVYQGDTRVRFTNARAQVHCELQVLEVDALHAFALKCSDFANSQLYLVCSSLCFMGCMVSLAHLLQY